MEQHLSQFCPGFFSPSSCASEMERWLEDIRMAIDLAEQSISPNTDLLSDGLPGNSKPIYYVRQSFSMHPFPPLLTELISFHSTFLSIWNLHSWLFSLYVLTSTFPMVLRAVRGRWGWAGVWGWTRQLALLPGASRSPWQHHCARLLASQHQRVNGGLQCCCGGIKHPFS